jgi:predicted ATP-binding protein involved in virulence
MRIVDLYIENVRLFSGEREKLVFDSDKSITAILGNNGSGKSTLLDTISVLLSSFVSMFPGMGEKQFSDNDIHIDGNRRADFLLAGMEIKKRDGEIISMMRSRKGNTKSPQPELKDIKAYADLLKSEVEKGIDEVALPIIAYYGTGRGNIKAPEKKRSFQRTYSRWDCYLDTLDPATNFKRFFAWYDTMEDEERREKERRHSFEYRSPVLQAVRKAINIFASAGEQGKIFKDPRIETKPLRFVLDECSKDGEVIRELRLEQFSDGYKIIIAMVADIASRMAEANPNMVNPLDSPGIVLIDEIDLHLHPRWQQSILRQLKETFRNVQFVVSTHSPIVLLGALDIVQIVRLDGQHIECDVQRDYSSYDVNQLLLSQLFGLDNVLTPEIARVMKRREELLLKSNLTDAEKTELKGLERQADKIPIGETAKSQRLYEIINKMAEKMGIEE